MFSPWKFPALERAAQLFNASRVPIGDGAQAFVSTL
jgi:hypothetical protein